MASFSIQLSDKDLNLLERIAESEDRRITDFVQLMFSRGLDYYYCDEIVTVKKMPDEYTQLERDQQVLNAELMAKYSDYNERVENGFKYVNSCISNWEKDPDSEERTDNLIDPLAKRIQAFALK